MSWPTPLILLDASVLLAAEDRDDDQHEASLALLRTGALATIDLALYETTNVAGIRWQDQAAAARLRQRNWTIAELGTLICADPLLGDHIAEPAHEHGLSSYHAAYLAGSRRLGIPLASCDHRDLVSIGLAQLPSTLTDQLWGIAATTSISTKSSAPWP
ncbi:MAG TPA: type II toxin-antitoxin system VapC family toxin [Solirubrobacteraceae bacterium]